jgi:5-methylcytosine-specific restriction endonuclease McrA
MCLRCKQEKPFADFCKKTRNKDGLNNWCRQCESIYKRQYRSGEGIKEKEEKYKQEHFELYAKYKKAYNVMYREKMKKYPQMVDIESIRASRRKYQRNNREKMRIYYQQYRKDNIEKIKEKSRLYQRDNLDKCRIRSQVRAARKKLLMAAYSNEQWELTKLYFDSKCSYCGKETELLTQEHFIPLSTGGEYTANNIIPACGSCNSSKGNKDFVEWYPKQKFYSKRREQKIMKYLNYKNGFQQLSMIQE